MPGERYRLLIFDDPRLLSAEGTDVDLPLGKPFALLCYLAVDGGEVGRDRLARMLWPTSDRKRARASLRDALWRLRNATDSELVQAEGEELAADPEMLDLDLHEFEEHLKHGRLKQAVDLWGDGPFHGFSIPRCPEWSRWTEGIRTDLERRLSDSLFDEASTVLHAGHQEESLSLLEALLDVCPYSERVHLQRVEILLDLGRTEGAREALVRAREVIDQPREPHRLDQLEDRATQQLERAVRVADCDFSAPMVGRGRELALMAAHWRTVSSGRPRLVGLVGPAGAGKSRLLGEFLVLTAGSGHQTVQVPGSRSEASIPLNAVAELARELYRLPGGAGVAPTSNAVLEGLVPSLGHAGSTSGLTQSVQQAAVGDALADLVAAVAEEQPLILILENFQWIDPQSRTILAQLPRMVRGRPVLFLVTCRSAVKESDSSVEELRALEEHDRANVLYLENLTQPEVAELLEFLDELEPERRDHLARRLHALADGNPGDLTKLLLALRERGAILVEGEQWHLDDYEVVSQELDAIEAEQATTETSRRTHHAPIVAAIIAAATLTLVFSWASAQFDSVAAVPAYGGGSLILVQGDSAVEYTPPIGGSTWTRNRVRTTSGVIGPTPAVTSTGELRWFGYVPDTAGQSTNPPYVVELLPDQSVVTLLRRSGDVSFGDLSPGGHHALLLIEADESSTYRSDLYRLDLDNGTLERIFIPIAFGGARPRWSPDGRLISKGLNAPHDSLIILRPDGERVLAVPAPDRDLQSTSWCGSDESLVLITLAPGSGPKAWKFEIDGARTEPFNTTYPLLGTSAACSPDGSAVAYVGLVEQRPRVVLQAWDGSVEMLPDDVDANSVGIYWEPSPHPIPVRIEVTTDSITVPWGGRGVAQASVNTSGEPGIAPPAVEWASRDRAIASVDPDGVVSGNAPGRTWIVGEVLGWLRDSLVVTVQGEPTGSVLLERPLAHPLEDRWWAFGYPEAEIVPRRGQEVLRLPGDGVYSDGVVSKKSFGLDRGGTIDLAFLLPLTRPDRQRIQVCLAELPEDVPTPIRWPFSTNQHLCFIYPARELVDFHPQEFRLESHLHSSGPKRVSDLFDTEDWNSISLQLRPDGIASAFVNGQLVQTLDLPVRNTPDTGWRVVIRGASAETELYVRDLVLWGETRHPVPSG